MKQGLVNFKPQKGDVLDEMWVQLIVQFEMYDLLLTRLGNGFYMYGTKKIFCKIMNNKMQIMVGGGYLSAEEFNQTYASSETQKVQKLSPEETQALHAPEVRQSVPALSGGMSPRL